LTNMPPGFGGMDPGRAARLGGQAALSGLTSVAALPLDLPVLASKGLNYGVEAGLGAAGRGLNRMFETGKFTYNTPTGIDVPIPSEAIKDAASWAARKLGYEPAVPETIQEKALYNIAEQGAGAAGGAGILSKLAQARKLSLAEPGALPRAGDKFLQPYMERPVSAVVGDTAAGAGAGGGLTVSQELPKEIRETGGGTVGTMADLAAMLSGGVGAGSVASGMMRAPTALGNLVQKNRPAFNVPIDPVTGLAVSNQTADDVSRILRGSVTSEPTSLAESIRQGAQGFRDQGLPVPTTGQLAEGQLAGVERRQRTQPPALFQPDASEAVRQQNSFIARDTAQKQAAADELNKISQPDVSREVLPAPAPAIPGSLPRQQPLDSELFARRAQERADAELAARQRQVDQPTGRARGVEQARREEAVPVTDATIAAPDANRRIDTAVERARVQESRQANVMYDDPVWAGSQVPVEPLQARAAAVRQNSTDLSPVHPDVEPFLARIEAQQGRGAAGWELDSLNADLEKAISGSLKNGNLFRQLKSLKDGVAESIAALPTGHAGREARMAADTNWRERVLPNFRQLAGETYDLAQKTQPGQVRAATTGERFLGPGAVREDAQQLARIADLTGAGPQVAADARTIIFDQLARSGAIKDGVLDPAEFTKWRNLRNDVIQGVPGLENEVRGMLADAQRGAGRASRFADEIAAAEARQKQSQSAIAKGPVGKLETGTPREVVDGIMQGNNAAKNIADLRKQTGNSPDAVKSLKANVADHFIDKVKTIDPSLTENAGVNLRKLVNQFNDKREALVAAGFTPEEMQAVQRAQTVLMPLLNRNVQATVGSITAENTAAAMRPLEMALKIHYGTLKGGSVFRNVKQGLALAKGDNTAAIEQLLTRTMFDPELAATLLTRDVAKAGTPAWNAQLQKVLRRTEAAKGLAEGEEE
jgi:hypothetical protein